MSGWRVRVLGSLLFLGLLGVLGRLFHLQVVQGEELARAASARIRRIELIEAARGRILDREGRVLAEDVPAHELWADPSRAGRLLEDRQGMQRLARVLGESGFPQALEDLSEIDRRWKERVASRSRAPEPEPRRWLSGLSETAVYWLTCRLDEYPGLSLERRMVRRYPQGACAAHLLGAIGLPDAKDLERIRGEGRDLGVLIQQMGRAEVLLDEDLRRSGIFADDPIGQQGIERFAEETLRGRRGARVVSVDLVKGRRREEYQIEPAEPGQDVHLTIDLVLQKAAEEALDWRRGAVVALDPRTGEVLALASRPGFDLNRFRQEYGRLLKDPGHPLVNRAIGGVYPPGSIFKLVTAATALDSGRMAATEAVMCEGAVHEGSTRYGCNGVHGTMDLAAALEVSCNTYFFLAGRKVGSRALAEKARAFGFGALPALPLEGGEAGELPLGDPLNMSVGQGKLLVTPIQAACMVAAVANGGRAVRPVLLPSGVGSAPEQEPFLKPETLAALRTGMRRSVHSGTASHAGLASYRALGKTGTAQVGGPGRRDGPEPHAWFVGYAPEEAPELAVAVIVEHGGTGGDVAAPVAEALFRVRFGRELAVGWVP